MPYPIEILPKPGYKKEISTSELISNKKAFLVRRSTKPEDIDEVKLREICSSPRDLFGLSTNLHGRYPIEYLGLKVTNRPIKDPWDGENCLTSEQIVYIVEERVYPIFFDISELHGKKFPYHRNINLNKGFETKKFEGFITIDHTPNNSNYWHFELSCYDDTMKKFNRNKVNDKIKEDAEEFLTQHLIHLAFREVPYTDDVNEELYQK